MRARRYEDAIVALKAKVKESEGEDMREAVQDKVGRLDVCRMCMCMCMCMCVIVCLEGWWGHLRDECGAGQGGLSVVKA
jgi:hypothetical protein